MKQGITNGWFWLVFDTCILAHRALQHLLNALQEPRKPGEDSIAFQLVTGKASNIFKEYISLLAGYDFTTLLRTVDHLESGSPINVDRQPERIELSESGELAIRFVIHIILHCACEFYCRILHFLNWYPTETCG